MWVLGQDVYLQINISLQNNIILKQEHTCNHCTNNRKLFSTLQNILMVQRWKQQHQFRPLVLLFLFITIIIVIVKSKF